MPSGLKIGAPDRADKVFSSQCSRSSRSYGGSASIKSQGPRPSPPRRRKARASARTTVRSPAGTASRPGDRTGPADGLRSRPKGPVKSSTFFLSKASVRASASTQQTDPAPLLQASKPSAPEPANRSRTRDPVTREASAEKMACRTMSWVGRMAAGTVSRRPPSSPPVMRMMQRAGENLTGTAARPGRAPGSCRSRGARISGCSSR